jgi:hypothetical protein
VVSTALSDFSANPRLELSNILDRSQNPIICTSDCTPKVKLSKVEKQQMFNPKVLTNAAFATIAVISLGFKGHAASAESILVTRGPHGATSIVNEVPVGATALPTTPSQGYPKLITRGPGGAAHIVNESKEMKPIAQAHTFPKTTSIGSHGAARIAN